MAFGLNRAELIRRLGADVILSEHEEHMLTRYA